MNKLLNSLFADRLSHPEACRLMPAIRSNESRPRARRAPKWPRRSQARLLLSPRQTKWKLFSRKSRLALKTPRKRRAKKSRRNQRLNQKRPKTMTLRRRREPSRDHAREQSPSAPARRRGPGRPRPARRHVHAPARDAASNAKRGAARRGDARADARDPALGRNSAPGHDPVPGVAVTTDAGRADTRGPLVADQGAIRAATAEAARHRLTCAEPTQVLAESWACLA